MARRPRKSGFESAVEALALLPWQACLALAPITYFGFHWLAGLDASPPKGMSQLGASIQVTIFRVAGMFLQVLVPAMLLFAALMSWLAKRRRNRLLVDAETSTAQAPLLNLSWRDFEQLVGAHFERISYAVAFTPAGADGGVDVVAKKDGEMFLIQCKQWRATQVGVGVVRELYGVMAARGATGGYVVSVGAFTDAARDFASGRNIQLVDAHRLLNPQATPRSSPAILSAPTAATVTTQTPPCPKCGASMVRRVAKQGSNQGQAFYGCSSFPQCRGMLPLQP
jgi:restriction system protein